MVVCHVYVCVCCSLLCVLSLFVCVNGFLRGCLLYFVLCVSPVSVIFMVSVHKILRWLPVVHRG